MCILHFFMKDDLMLFLFLFILFIYFFMVFQRFNPNILSMKVKKELDKVS